MKRHILTFFLFLTLATTSFKGTFTHLSLPVFDYEPGKVIVTLRHLSQDTTILSHIKTKYSLSNESLLFSERSSFTYLFATEQDVLTVCRALNADPSVEHAHPNALLKLCFVPDDPYYHSLGSWGQPYDDLWALKEDKLDCEPAWDISQGEGVVVAIVDSGIDYTHDDLNANIWINEDEIPRNGKDDDGNGYIDDIIGWNFINNNNDVMDTLGHGSHCAGVIAAQGDNGKGIIGVAPKAKLMGIKAITGDGESTVDKVVQAIKYAADNGADIINLSWGVPTRWWAPIPPLTEIINYAYSKGCIIVCAAGNNNDDAAYYPPANYANVITVGATTQRDEKCSFSNYGAVIDVVAPGGGYENELGHPGKEDTRNILTTLPQQFSMAQEYAKMKVASGYYRFAGTSTAAPYVTGVCALLKSIDPSLTNAEIEAIIKTSADDLGTRGKDNIFGHGRVNAYRACSSITENTEESDDSTDTEPDSTNTNTTNITQENRTTDTGNRTGGMDNLFGGITGGETSGMGGMPGGLMGGSSRTGGLGNLSGRLLGGNSGMGGIGSLFGGLMGGNGETGSIFSRLMNNRGSLFGNLFGNTQRNNPYAANSSNNGTSSVQFNNAFNANKGSTATTLNSNGNTETSSGSNSRTTGGLFGGGLMSRLTSLFSRFFGRSIFAGP